MSSGVPWWDEWQPRILVLGSLGFQWFLVLVVPLRNYTIQRWLRACIWLVSICADVLAIYALATLLSRQQAAGRWWISGGFDDGDYYYDSRALTLEALWTPLLLVHLGGREELTANNAALCWVRHAAVLVTVTVYAFSTSLRYLSDSSDGRRLLASAALLLVAAVVSSCVKPWVLRRASVRRLVAKSSLEKGSARTKTKTKQQPIISGGWWFTDLGDRYKCWKELKPRGTAPMLSQGDKVQILLSGMSLHAARATLETRKKKPEQKILEPLKPWRRSRQQHQHPNDDMVMMKPWLRQAFGLIYTREAVLFTPAYLACHALLVPSLYVAAVVLLFVASHKKHGYSRADVSTTYALLGLTAALDVLGMFVSEMVRHCWLLLPSGGAGASSCENLPGHNLMDSVLWTIRRPILSKLLLRCYKGGSFVKDKDGLYCSVLGFIRDKLQDKDEEKYDKNKDDQGKGKDEEKDDKNKDDQGKGKDEEKDDKNKDDEGKGKDDKDEEKDDKNKDDEYKGKDDENKGKDNNFDLDLSSYRSLSKRNWILRDKDLELVRGNKYQNIQASLRNKPFDVSVLIWHIATDLCFRVNPPKCFRFRPPPNKRVGGAVCTEAISNYMAYLLDHRPEMLMAGSRQHLFTEAMANMEHVVKEATKGLRPKLREKQPFDDVILGNIKQQAAILKNKEAYTVIHDACKLAEELLDIPVPKDDDDFAETSNPRETTRWELMHRMWVGMLCYSASMCRGDLHAKSLGEGGEFLSNVWLLISLIGGRTLADKLQMPDDDPEPEDKVAVAPARDNGEQKAEPEAAGDKVQTPDDVKPKDKRRSRAADFLRQGLDAGSRARPRG